MEQQQQQQEGEEEAENEGEDGEGEAAGVDDSPSDTAPAVCSPFLLLMLPTEAAAEAAACQHGPLLAAAGVTSCLLKALDTSAMSADAPAAAAATAAAAAAAATTAAAAAAAAADDKDFDGGDAEDDEDEWFSAEDAIALGAAAAATAAVAAAVAAAAGSSPTASAVAAAKKEAASVLADVKRLRGLRRCLREELRQTAAKDNEAVEKFTADIYKKFMCEHYDADRPADIRLPQQLLDEIEQYRVRLQKEREEREAEHSKVGCIFECLNIRDAELDGCQLTLKRRRALSWFYQALCDAQNL
jgi:hypothetical protein